MAAATTGLAAKGFRFVLQKGRFSWTHPAEIVVDAVDCTDMDDSQFETLVRETYGSESMLRGAA